MTGNTIGARNVKKNGKRIGPLTKKKKKMKAVVHVSKELLIKYTRGEGLNDEINISGMSNRKKILKKEKKIQWVEKQAARAEILLTEEPGYLVAEEGEKCSNISQREIVSQVDITSATKYFNLDLKFGPYSVDYTLNGRHLLIGGKKGHVAAFDWITKDLLCEINVMEEVVDVQWLHIQTMFAVAQKNWVYIYDNQGVELHCLKRLHRVFQMTFLPHHFLLAACNEDGWLKWLDVTIGELISEIQVKHGRPRVMVQNPYNAVLCLGHSKGVVSMWSPRCQKPLVQMLCHSTGVQSVAIDRSGKYMATASFNRELKIWDIRSIVGPVQNYVLKGSPTQLSFSQRSLLAAAIGNNMNVYKDCHLKKIEDPYLSFRARSRINSIQFCPYEDILGLGCDYGFTSILVPGCGEPNYDALEANPMQSKSQRREAEVKSLLEKIQPEMITLDPTVITEMNIPSLKERIDTKIKLLNLKPPKLDFVPKKKKGRNPAKVKKIVKESRMKAFSAELKEAREKLNENDNCESENVDKQEMKTTKHILDRFVNKKKRV